MVVLKATGTDFASIHGRVTDSRLDSIETKQDT